MSTPMRHGPSQQGRTPSQIPGAAPTPPVSTPFSASQAQTAFSPPSGSRTSPQHVKKSPATSFTLKQQPPNDGASAMNFDSPSATAALGALGMNNHLDLHLENLSMGTMTLGKSEEEAHKRKMDFIIETVKRAARPMVSNEGLERLAREIGLECLWEDNPAGGPHSKTLVMAGSGLALEIIITNHVVENVSLTYPECSENAQKHVGKAADILLEDLKLAEGQSPLTKTLLAFQPNLERLAALDKLSVLPTLNCYDAVAGLYESFMKLHEWDMRKLRDDPTIPEENISDNRLQMYALCLRHGVPMMHARGKIGLTLDYWKTRRRLTSVDIHKKALGICTWGMLIECAPRNDMMHIPGIRVSENWISDEVEKTQNLTSDDMLMQQTSGYVLDWQEPEMIFLPSGEETKTETGISVPAGPKIPDVIFTATFDPPVVVTTAAAAHIYSIAGIPLPESSVTFDAIVFPVAPDSGYDPSEPRIIRRAQAVTTIPNPNSPSQTNLTGHKNTLFIYKPVYGQVLSKVPMQHPRQLMAMLPVLRQFAFLSTLLAKSFKPKPNFAEIAPDNANWKTTPIIQDDITGLMPKLPLPSITSDVKASLSVDITLTAHPIPQLLVVFPFKSRTANITLEIGLGGRVHVVSHNDVFQETAHDNTQEVRLDKAWAERKLEICEDIGVWVELIRMMLEKE
ncbi:mediator of RNA polymerase II transcription subunit 1 domain-containing protein [Apiospora rasikravindrae]|uniref:Mediator of RNA polymerase II transcription subunit 1 n=1 Tax=Apiospora rasikravindrae TaxID=990691 RepID=A0ABR1S238_9PEZI